MSRWPKPTSFPPLLPCLLFVLPDPRFPRPHPAILHRPSPHSAQYARLNDVWGGRACGKKLISTVGEKYDRKVLLPPLSSLGQEACALPIFSPLVLPRRSSRAAGASVERFQVPAGPAPGRRAPLPREKSRQRARG